ncbi:stage II sporulation E family protein [Treponema primitia ZAS-2]|uniref:Stage II sporulation E family protein n=1 Tax=Treponema primitia (strain ATCC BAA-887 / DSM 12427 / ZAS-2) TaxID=545694 RepID=D8L134_TREPZ|nr:SpoIIE family protein phosphatase [Treponema primitia]ADJ19578.1 putative stage II sporulation E family protein [Treponema primitia ZAS-2]AEF84321.1 stage II sporulation E family protein [Treponema primitia ZAS-2]
MTELLAPGVIFVEVDYFQVKKAGQTAAGDIFLYQRSPSGGRIITTLSDGLGSGIKANVLASLTATMLNKFVSFDIPIKRSAELIINSLPVCSVRDLSYATFTLLDINHSSKDSCSLKILEYDNPPAIIVQNDKIIELEKDRIPIERKNKKTGPEKEIVSFSTWTAYPGDRIVFFSDGVTQAGMGSEAYPPGWGIENAKNFILKQIETTPLISARELSENLVTEAEYKDMTGAKDDITCAVVYFREPRDLLVFTGPPYHPESDKEIAETFVAFKGKKIVSGGTSAQIISRELGKKIERGNLLSGGGPPLSKIEGVDLVCEGILTLGATAELLEENKKVKNRKDSPAHRMTEYLLNSDRIVFLVGTKINEAHQDPTMPEELEIRRNVVKKIAALLEENFLKEVHIQYV